MDCRRGVYALAAAVLLSAPAAARLARAEEGATAVPAAHVEEALTQAGANRPALEATLAHFRAKGDALRLEAARFLVANMPGRGFVVAGFKDPEGSFVEYDPLGYATFREAERALDAIEKQRGTLETARVRFVPDLETVTTEFLVAHVEHAFRAWERTPAGRRLSFPAFLEHVLPYRGSEEPVEDWLGPILGRVERGGPAANPASALEAWKAANEEVGRRLRFDERYYLHPTDQGFAEMERSGMGRCEDLANRLTYEARARGLATAADYTPAWGDRDNNHAWNVLLDAQGRGSEPAYAHAAKVYRKTFALDRAGLADLLPEGREAPNRWLSGRAYRDVTDSYGDTSDVPVDLPASAAGHPAAYACVFNGGAWVAVAWARVEAGRAVLARLGRGGRLGRMLWLPAVHDGKALAGIAPPFVLHGDGRVEPLAGTAAPVALEIGATCPEQRNPDTREVTPKSRLKPGAAYVLRRWEGSSWKDIAECAAGAEPLRFDALAPDALHWLVEKDGKELERPFTIEEGRPRFL